MINFATTEHHHHGSHRDHHGSEEYANSIATSPWCNFVQEGVQKNPPNSHYSHLNYLRMNGKFTEAVTILDSIAKSGLKVTSTTYMNLLQSCIDTNYIQLGQKIYERIDVVEELNSFVETKLVSMYAKCGFLDDAPKVFYAMLERNLYSWLIMIGETKGGGAFLLNDERWRFVLWGEKNGFWCE
ncbi:pentatricopeptide repeat-containing protein At1g19720-like [Pyrus x bretschneideri]|uniref:pentatricopeptide repeat-containing protein At1g19720-like n=1 Tax=Pyrus x bretschneideri TaxID=225117 RepID=UPI002030D706|nr:pentatricopeptide repeat-containing protein At1g19720-like [Pyrus x bretschneideri]